MRNFEDKPATKENVPLLVGLYGPSGGGKTFSALRLATGIQRITGREIFYIDTESKRALHYADRFKFRHVEFNAPYGSLDYMAAIEHCIKRGAGIIVVDSATHEHAGVGGHLEQHDAETDRLAKEWKVSRKTAQMSAWAKPKSERTKLINYIICSGISGIFCFRAKEKIKMPKRDDSDREVKTLGFMPIAGEEWVFEMTLNALLLPNSGGIPSWHPEEMGEKAMVKLPVQFKELFTAPRPLDEAHGEALAKWAAGTAPNVKPDESINKLVNAFGSIGVDTAMLETKLGHSLREATTSEIDDLRKVYAAIDKGKAKVDEHFGVHA